MHVISDDFPVMMEIETILHSDSPFYGQKDPNCPPVGVSFGLYPVIDGEKTKQAGHNIYKDVEFVKIVVPGDGKSLYFQPAEDSHRQRFPVAYAAYRQREHKPVIEGMRIEEWAVVSRSVALNLKALHIDTVEALAAVHDGNVSRIGSNGRELREKARAWIATAKGGAEAVRDAAEKQELKDQIAALQAQIVAIQQSRDDRAQEEPLRRPVGRPPKAA